MAWPGANEWQLVRGTKTVAGGERCVGVSVKIPGQVPLRKSIRRLVVSSWSIRFGQFHAERSRLCASEEDSAIQIDPSCMPQIKRHTSVVDGSDAIVAIRPIREVFSRSAAVAASSSREDATGEADALPVAALSMAAAGRGCHWPLVLDPCFAYFTPVVQSMLENMARVIFNDDGRADLYSQHWVWPKFGA